MIWNAHRGSILLLILLTIGCAGKSPEPKVTQGPPTKPPICAIRSPELCLQDGIDLYNGLRGERDPDAARSKFELSCAGGDQRGCTWLGIALTRTTQTGAEQARAVELWDRACADDVIMACTQLGSHLMSLGWQQADAGDRPAADETFQAARLRLDRACAANPDEVDRELWGIAVRGYACGLLASSYEHGFGVDPDLRRAYQLNQRSCDQGWIRSCAQLGYFHEHGIHVDADPVEAARLYDDACEGGDGMGCHNLAILLFEGRGVDPEPERGRRLLRRACELGYPGACEAFETLDD